MTLKQCPSSKMTPNKPIEKYWQCQLTSPGGRLSFLRGTGQLSDLTITFPGQSKVFQVHRLILAMSSPVFEAMLCGPMAEGDVLSLPQDPPEVFECVLDYLYRNYLRLSDVHTAIQIYHLATKYQMDDLCGRCSIYLSSKLEARNFPIVFDLAVLLDDEVLLKKCGEVLSMFSDKILCSDEVALLGRPSFLVLLKHECLFPSSEVLVFKALLNWAKKHPEAIEGEQSSLTSLLRPRPTDQKGKILIESLMKNGKDSRTVAASATTSTNVTRDEDEKSAIQEQLQEKIPRESLMKNGEDSQTKAASATTSTNVTRDEDEKSAIQEQLQGKILRESLKKNGKDSQTKASSATTSTNVTRDEDGKSAIQEQLQEKILRESLIMKNGEDSQTKAASATTSTNFTRDEDEKSAIQEQLQEMILRESLMKNGEDSQTKAASATTSTNVTRDEDEKSAIQEQLQVDMNSPLRKVSLRDELEHFLPYVKFLSMTTDEFVSEVLPLSLFTHDESIYILMNIKGIPNVPIPSIVGSQEHSRQSKLKSVSLAFCKHHFGPRDQKILREFTVSKPIYVRGIRVPAISSLEVTLVRIKTSNKLIAEGKWQGTKCEFEKPVKLVPTESYSMLVNSAQGTCAGCECMISSEEQGLCIEGKTIGMSPIHLDYLEAE